MKKMKKIFLIFLFLHMHHVIGQAPLFPQVTQILEEKGIPLQNNQFENEDSMLQEYDFIVVGSGPAGSAVANRLSEECNWNVLLLEGGGEGSFFNDIPACNEYTVLDGTSINYEVERENNACLGLVDGRCHWPNGYGIGGGSIINAMMHTRGHPSDYDEWAEEGNVGWSYKDVLPYFLKLENMSIPGLAESQYHSTTGPVHVQYSFLSELGKTFLKAGQQLGYDLIDYNNPNTRIGFSQTQTTTKGLRRFSAASAYLLPVKSRSNVHIMKNAYVTKVIINKYSKIAHGVCFKYNNEIREVYSRKEVILSAGAFGSPKILMLSGIGPAKHLQKMCIPTIVNLPVGENLQEHLSAASLTFLINTTDSATTPKQIATIESEFRAWLNGANNSLANNLAEALAYIKTKYASNKPDIEILSYPSCIAGDILLKATRNISEDVFNRTWGPILFAEGFNLFPIMLYPQSRGTVKLQSSDPDDPIMIDGNFVHEHSDIDVMIEGFRAVINLIETEAYKKIGATLNPNPVYGCESYEFNSDEYWECTIRAVPIQLHHQCGTCRMGPCPSKSVVDQRLRVHGLKNLRVADASIIPKLPGAHTMAPCYMIGEKAADMIKEDWGVLN